jgi:uncharacterized membrane protein
MDDFSIARALHILAIVLWVGGVGFVTTAATPAIRADYPPPERLAAFHRFERKFVSQARFWVALAGASGLWMVWRGDLWARYLDARFWWMHAMAALWLIFMLMLFVIEPFVLHRRFVGSASPEKDFDRLETMHRILLTLLVITIGGAALSEPRLT